MGQVGARLVLVKQVGLNVAADVLACAAPHRIGGALVVVVGDDPGATSSQVEGDSRRLLAALEVPCFEPAGAGDMAATLVEALHASAVLMAPTAVRVTGPMMLAMTPADPSALMAQTERLRPFDPTWWKTDFVAHRQALLDAELAMGETDSVVVRAGDNRLRIVASGQLAAQACSATDFELLQVRRVVPPPRTGIQGFVDSGRTPILVLEEGGVLLEDLVRQRDSAVAVMGRTNGFVPLAGPVDWASSVQAALAARPLPSPTPSSYPGDPHADLSPFGSLWAEAAALGLTPIVTDAGHNGAAINLSGDPAPFSYGLGSSIGVAAGIAMTTGKPCIAVTGDMGFFHTGLPALAQVSHDRLRVIIFVDDDGTARTTGGQPTPSGFPGPGQQRLSVAAVASGLGVSYVEEVTRPGNGKSGPASQAGNIDAERGS